MVDDKHLNRNFLLFQFQSKLLLKSYEEGKPVRIPWLAAATRGRFRRPFQLEVIQTLQPG